MCVFVFARVPLPASVCMHSAESQQSGRRKDVGTLDPLMATPYN